MLADAPAHIPLPAATEDPHAIDETFFIEYRRDVEISRDVRRDGHTMTAKEHVGQARVRQLGDAGLLAEVERDVLHVRLDLAERERELVVVLVADRVVRRELDEVVGLHRDDVWEQVRTGQREVLDDNVEGVVGVLNTRDGNVPNLKCTISSLFTI